MHFYLIYFLSSFEDMLINFRERGRKGERETEIPMWERNIMTQDQTQNLGMCPNKELNLQPFDTQDYAPFTWTTLART